MTESVCEGWIWMKDSERNSSTTGVMGGERVLSGLEVEALLRIGSEKIFLLFTQTRLILAHQAKMGRSTVPLYGLLGKMSEGLRRSPDKTGMLQKMADMEPNGILALHPDNLSIEYPDIVRVTFEPYAGSRSKLTLVTSDQKIELYASLVAADGVRESVESLLPGKIDYLR